MATLADALVSLAGPLAKKVLTSIGIGVVTYAGVSTAAAAAISAAKTAFTGMTGSAAAIVSIAGVPTALSIIAGGITAGISMLVLKRLQLTTG